MVIYLDEYRKARLISDRQPETQDGIGRPAMALVSNVFRFHKPGNAGLAHAAVGEDLDRIYALASQS